MTHLHLVCFDTCLLVFISCFQILKTFPVNAWSLSWTNFPSRYDALPYQNWPLVSLRTAGPSVVGDNPEHCLDEASKTRVHAQMIWMIRKIQSAKVSTNWLINNEVIIWLDIWATQVYHYCGETACDLDPFHPASYFNPKHAKFSSAQKIDWVSWLRTNILPWGSLTG